MRTSWPPSTLLIAILGVPLIQSGQSPGAQRMQPDVERLVRAAEAVSGRWLRQPPPPVPEVEVVASHGRAVVPLLLELMSDDGDAERDARQWHVQQQASLALCAIYGLTPPYCGRAYCDGDPPERIANVRNSWRKAIEDDAERRALAGSVLIDRFLNETDFTQQHEIGELLANSGDRSVIPQLETWLTHLDRHVRGNVAFVIARLGDQRGFETIAAVLANRSDRVVAQGIPGWAGKVTPEALSQAQIKSDRYYAVHLLGLLKNPRAVYVLVPLLDDKDVGYHVPWALAQIGDRRAIAPLVQRLETGDATTRVAVISALETLNAREAVPALQKVVDDAGKTRLGDAVTVSQAARHAIAELSRQ
jgi:hypothetical protein